MFDEKATAVLVFLILSLFSLITCIAAYQVFGIGVVENSRESILKQQFRDVGSAIANDVCLAVVFLPHGGNLTYSKRLPLLIAGYDYTVDVVNGSVIIRTVGNESSLSYYTSGIEKEMSISLIKRDNETRGIKYIKINLRRL